MTAFFDDIQMPSLNSPRPTPEKMLHPGLDSATTRLKQPVGGVGGSLQTACFQCFKQKNSCQANDQINKTLKTFVWLRFFWFQLCQFSSQHTGKMVTSHVTKFKHHVHFHNANPRPRCFRTTLSQWPFGVYDWWFTNSRIPRFRKGIKN